MEKAGRPENNNQHVDACAASTLRVCVYGIVQGVGFRPFVARLARRVGITGTVANRGSYVEIFARGNDGELQEFLTGLKCEAPERSAILKVDLRHCEDRVSESFEIIESEKEEGDIFVSPDIATCPRCKAELFDPANRRFLHPFINCTACGPRVTILDAMPYDRERTSMKEFPMCPACADEYYHPGNRRYDAQPVCCNDCGPKVYILGRQERGREAITAVRRAILDGQIIAIKGIGGFHLCCDATNEEAVSRLRERKTRPMKPFAVMMRDMAAVERECVVSTAERSVLDGPQKPIILLKKKDCSCLAPSVAPDNPNVGVMLPYAPIQMLLFDYNDEVEMSTDCFVMTSGNVSGAPICRTEADAEKELSGFCDLILAHDRKIRLRADDSVMGFYRDEPYMIRRSRGYAPLPVMMDGEWYGQVLAAGGELKNTFCVGKNRLFYPSPYVGDMEDVRTVVALKESVTRMCELLETEPEYIVCDMHPGYHSAAVAREIAAGRGLPLIKVQHHYAHILSCMAENDLPMDAKVIGVSFDGTGYGTDGSIWGGEIMTAGYSDFTRVASIAPFIQTGGDASAKEGWRIAASMINSIYGDDAGEICEKLGLCDPKMSRLCRRMAEKGINAVISTSAGRLFDAVSAILGVRRVSTFEGEASMTLQFRAEAWLDRRGEIDSGVIDECLIAPRHGKPDGCLILPTDELVRDLTDRRLAGEDIYRLAYRFHAILARQIVAACETVSRDSGLTEAALSGGVFQNQLLLSLVEDGLIKAGLEVYRHHLIPPNDGGIALGQAVYRRRK
ncbi:MAG: carbamoyltransferase HypF [Clostridiales bacterium]|nr:carbamoyltransferase HypF [Clostridiales bacterium]